jgi:hypothetical protein
MNTFGINRKNMRIEVLVYCRHIAYTDLSSFYLGYPFWFETRAVGTILLNRYYKDTFYVHILKRMKRSKSALDI